MGTTPLQMTPRRITLHCSATKNGDDSVTAATIEGWHLAKGWDGLGYHYVIEIDGTVVVGRPLNTQGAHVEGENHDNIGICLVGGNADGVDAKYTRAQWKALEQLLDTIFLNFYEIPKWAIYCHNQFPSAIKQGKTCPGMLVNKILWWYHGQADSAVREHVLDGTR